MATLTGKITDVTGRAPDSISSITVKAPSARIGSGTDVIVSSPAKVTLNKTTGDITISGLHVGLSWLYIEGDGWSDSIPLAVAVGFQLILEAVANASGIPGIADYVAMLRSSGDHARLLARAALDGEFGEVVRAAQAAAATAEQAATSADARATSADARAASAENKVDSYTPRVAALEAMSGLSPESPVDGQTANLVAQSDTLTSAAVGTVVRSVVYDVAPTGTLEGDKAAVIAASLAAKNAGRLEVTMAPGHYLLDGVDVAAVHGRYLVGDGVTFSPGSFVYPFRTAEVATISSNSVRSTGQGRIAIEIDDGLMNHWTHIFPACKELGITMGTGWHTDNGARWIAEAHRHGWEVIAHMPHDLDWRTVPLGELEEAAISCLDAIEEQTGTREGIGFIYPRHNRNKETDRVLSKYFTRGRGHNDPTIYRRGHGHPWLTSAFFLDPRFASGDTRILEEKLRQVAAQDGDMVFYMHSGNETHAVEQIAALRKFVSYARSLGIQIVNPGQIWGGTNIIPDPYMEHTDHWTLGAALSWDESTKYHGDRSVKFTPSGSGNSGGSLVCANPYLPSMTPRDGMFSVYRLSARIKTDGATIPSERNGIRFAMQSFYRDITGETPGTIPGGAATDWLLPSEGNEIPAMDWERIQALTYIGPATTTAQPSVVIQNIAEGSSPIWIDEVKMELVGYVTEVSARSKMVGTGTARVILPIHDLARHTIIISPDSSADGEITWSIFGTNQLMVTSTSAADVMDFTVSVRPSQPYASMSLSPEGA